MASLEITPRIAIASPQCLTPHIMLCAFSHFWLGEEGGHVQIDSNLGHEVVPDYKDDLMNGGNASTLNMFYIQIIGQIGL